ncbi:MAG TPA: glycogen debranching enzyme GlgX, partial [Candidatus Methylomirabilis sp.]
MRECELRHQTDKRLSPGKFYPLGATPTGDGVNFAIYSQTATEVFLLLFEEVGGQPTDTIRMENRTRFIWHTLVHGLKAGQL